MSAIERVERFLVRAEKNPYGAAGHVLTTYTSDRLDILDLRAVLRLAKQAAELKRRVRLALKRDRLGPGFAREVLDLRKPLPRGRR